MNEENEEYMVCENCGAYIDEYEYYSNCGVCDKCFSEIKNNKDFNDYVKKYFI